MKEPLHDLQEDLQRAKGPLTAIFWLGLLATVLLGIALFVEIFII